MEQTKRRPGMLFLVPGLRNRKEALKTQRLRESPFFFSFFFFAFTFTPDPRQFLWWGQWQQSSLYGKLQGSQEFWGERDPHFLFWWSCSSKPPLPTSVWPLVIWMPDVESVTSKRLLADGLKKRGFKKPDTTRETAEGRDQEMDPISCCLSGLFSNLCIVDLPSFSLPETMRTELTDFLPCSRIISGWHTY